MIGDSRACGRCLYIPDMFFFVSWQGSACFANVIPRATVTGYFMDNQTLKHYTRNAKMRWINYGLTRHTRADNRRGRNVWFTITYKIIKSHVKQVINHLGIKFCQRAKLTKTVPAVLERLSIEFNGDWHRFQPITSDQKTTRDLLAHIFPLKTQATNSGKRCFCYYFFCYDWFIWFCVFVVIGPRVSWPLKQTITSDLGSHILPKGAPAKSKKEIHSK